MGVYYRKFRKTGQRIWWLSYMVGGRQVFESSHSTSKRFAEKLLAIRKAEVAAGRYEILKPAPRLGDWTEKYLETVEHPNTKKRYTVSKINIVRFFGEDLLLSGVTPARIRDFISARRVKGVKSATINRDLRLLAQALKQAERERLLARSPFDLGKFFQSETDRRRPHILTEAEELRLLSVSSPRLRIVVVLGLDTGMRPSESLALKWTDVNLAEGVLQVRRSKTQAGIRAVPLMERSKIELLRWQGLVGPEFSENVFPEFENRRHKLLNAGRKAWANALKKAKLPYFPIYNLRHTFASRLTAAGVSPIVIAQLLGHSTTQIVPRYVQVLDQNRTDAIKKLELLRRSSVGGAFRPEDWPSDAEPPAS